MNVFKNQFVKTALCMLICIVTAVITLWAYIDKQNDLTELRMAIPAVAKDLKAIQEENTRLRYEVEQFQNPVHLMELMRKPEFSHLKFPYLQDEIIMPAGEVND
jgi:hypothetical protein